MELLAEPASRSFHSTISDSSTNQQIRRRAKRNCLKKFFKVGFFLGLWLMFTVFIILTPPYKQRKVIVPLTPNKVQIVIVEDEPTEDFIAIELMGKLDPTKTMVPPPASENASYIVVAIEKFNVKANKSVWKSAEWPVYVDISDSRKQHTLKNKFDLKQNTKQADNLMLTMSLRSTNEPDLRLQVTFLSLHNESMGLALNINTSPMNVNVSAWIALALLILFHVLICFEITDRTLAGLLVSISAIGVLCILNERPTIMKIIDWLDMQTLMLIFGMMLIISITWETGIFDYMALFIYHRSKGKTWSLLFILYMFTGITSAFMDNVTVLMLLAPVTLRLCELLEINASIVLVCLAIFSNIGGTLTPVGDLPNLIIACNKYVHNSGVNFGLYALHMFPGVILAMLLSYVLIYFMTRNKLIETNVQLRETILALEEQADNNKLTQYLGHIMKRLADLKARLKRQELGPDTRTTLDDTQSVTKVKHTIRDVPMLIKCAVVIAVSMVMFSFCVIPSIDCLMMGWAAVLGAILLLTLIDRSDIDLIIRRIDWSTLLFIATLFILMGALVDMGLIAFINDLIISIISRFHKDHQLSVAVCLILWSSAIMSAFVDNITITTLLLKLIIYLYKNSEIPIQPMIWALSFGACFGGTGTMLGSSANLVTAGIAKQHGHYVTFVLFLSIGFPIMLFSVLLANIYLFIVHCILTWH